MIRFLYHNKSRNVVDTSIFEDLSIGIDSKKLLINSKIELTLYKSELEEAP